MQEKDVQIVDSILEKVKMLAEVETDVELSELFGVKAGTISAWRKRNTMNYDVLITLCQKHNWDLNYILSQNDGNLSSNVKGNPNPKVHNQVTIKAKKSTTDQINNLGDNAQISNKFGSPQAVSEHNEWYKSDPEAYLNHLKEQINSKDIDIIKLKAQIELLKSLLDK